MKTSKRVVVYLQVMLAAMLLTCLFGAHTAYAELTEQEKNSSYGFFLWLSENEELSLSDADRTDAAVAAQLLKGTVSNVYETQVLNSENHAGMRILGTITPYATIVSATNIGAEGDATSLDNLKKAIQYIERGNECRAIESLIPLRVSSALMAMSEINANYQFTQYGHTRAFYALENLAGSSASGPVGMNTEYDPYDSWYTKEKNNYVQQNGGVTGHYETLTDRNNGLKMLLTGFGYSYNKQISGSSMSIRQYCSQHFSDDNYLCSIGEGIETSTYLTYLNRYICHVKDHSWDEGKDTKPATCLEGGKKKYTCTRCGVTKIEDTEALGHDWNAPVYTWSGDNSSVTATRTCKNDSSHVETETADTTSEVTKAATCEEKGETTYTASFNSSAFEKRTKTVDDVEALGHKWSKPVYTWSEDNSAVTATRTCENDSSHIETEAADTTSEVTKAATCEEKGETTYTSSFKNEAFEKQVKTVDDVEALGHKWGEPVYTWSEDYSAVTAKRTCENDSSHVETESVDTTSDVTKEATCEEKGETTYTACFSNKAFESQTKVVADIDALGHKWKAAGYKWADDNKTVQANVVCERNGLHIQRVVVFTTKKITKAPTCEEKGETTYTAAFSESYLSKQTKTVADIDALGHNWSTPEYTWSDDCEQVTASRTCSNLEGHSESVTTLTTEEVTKKPTCTEMGETTYTADFGKDGFETQTKTIKNVSALGHNWSTEYTVDKPATCTEEGSESKHCSVCDESDPESVRTIEKLPHKYGEWKITKEATCTEDGSREKVCEDCGDKITETIKATGHTWEEEYTEDKPATCTEEGRESKHCSVCDESNPESVRTIEKLPHKYGEWKITKEATCTEDGSREKVCEDCGDKVTEPIEAPGHTWEEEYTVDTPATCTEEGSKSIHCSVCGESKPESAQAIPKTDHSYGEWKVTKEATCTEEGSKEKTCSVCGDKVTEPIPIGDNHTWSDWKIVTPATTSSTGTKERICSVCDKTETQEIPKKEEPKAADGTAVGKGASAAAAEAAIVNGANEEGPSGTTFAQLSAKVKKAKKTSITLTWNRVAPKYIIYGNKCGKGQKYKKITTVAGTSFTQKGLAKGTYYKYMVVAVDAGGRVVATSKTMHAATSGKKVGNPKKVTVKKKTLKLKRGKTAKIKASIVKPKGKKVKNHRKLAYESANPKVATVAKNGKVKAVSKGTTYIYVYAQNGVYAKVKVIVQ